MTMLDPDLRELAPGDDRPAERADVLTDSGTCPDTSTDTDTDTELVLRAQAGDTLAFGLLARRYTARIHALALTVVRDRGEAEDVTQETLLKAWRMLHTLENPAAVRTWMFRIAHHQGVEVLRRRSSRSTFAVADVPDTADRAVAHGHHPGYGEPERAVEEAQAVTALKAALEELPESQRVVWTLAEIDELSYAEIAAVVGGSLGTVRGRLARARLNLGEAVRRQQ